MPYYERERALKLLLDNYKRMFTREHFQEMIIVDDGSERQPAKRATSDAGPFPWPVRIVRLTNKPYPRSPCIPINRAVSEARQKIVVLTQPEVELSGAHVLIEAVKEAVQTGPWAYVAAAVREIVGRHKKRWLNHPDHVDDPLNWFVVFHKPLWNAVGGFDEIYRCGIGYEDRDWLMRLQKHPQVIIRQRGDLVVEHLRALQGNSSRRESPECGRNREIFQERRWGHGWNRNHS